jgi:hypothetical protein
VEAVEERRRGGVPTAARAPVVGDGPAELCSLGDRGMR